MAKNIYVGNLPWQTTQDDLYSLFSQYGAVAKTQIISDRETGRSRGFGFVEMNDDAEAQAAIDALNNSDYNGRPLTVNEAKPREPRAGGGAGGTAAGAAAGAAAAGTAAGAAAMVGAVVGTAAGAGGMAVGVAGTAGAVGIGTNVRLGLSYR